MAKRETKQEIIDAFWNIYENKRIEKITVKEVCLKAACNRSTFYAYFTDVYDVLEQLEDNLLPNANDIPEVLAGRPLKDTNHLEYFDKKKKYLRILLSEHGDPAFTYKLKNTLKPSIAAFLKVNDTSNNTEYILEYVLSGMIALMTYHILNDNPIDDSEVIDTMKTLTSSINVLNLDNSSKSIGHSIGH